MALGDTLKGLLNEYAQMQTRGPNWRKQLEDEAFQQQRQAHEVEQMQQESEMAPLRRRAAELGVESGEQSLTTAKAKEAERRAGREAIAEEIRKGNLNPLWSAGPEGEDAAKFIESAPDRATARKHAELVIQHLEKQIGSEPSPEEAQATREAQRKLLGAQTSYYSDRGTAAASRVQPYAGAGVHDKVLDAAWSEAKARVDANNDNPGWFTGTKLKEGSPEYNRAIAEQQAKILEEQGYDPRAIAKSGLRPPVPERQFVKSPTGDCYMMQGEALAKVDCKLAEEADVTPDQVEGETAAPPQEPAAGPGLVSQGVQALIDQWRRVQRAAGNPNVK